MSRFGRVFALATAFAMATGFVAPSGSDQAAATLAKIEPRVLERIADGQAGFWVRLKPEADLRGAYAIHDWARRGEFVYNRLTSMAEESQSSLRAMLGARGVHYKSFAIANALYVTGGEEVVKDTAARPEVAEIRAPRRYRIPDIRNRDGHGRVGWNIGRIRAPKVWSDLGVRGEGSVVANIDTGVDYTHPALVRQYRGRLSGGGFDHNYNWFDPANACGAPEPCDNVDHGTHTMGVMVGEDATARNQIGVAPRARWIAAKGCESVFCSEFALMSSGEWLLAPTDLNGNNPRPDLRPSVVNNSWGGLPGDPFYRAIVRAWLASGIFPVFPPGSGGPNCGTSGSPGDYPESYAAGAFDINNQIASFSSRGPSAFGGIIKPDIAAPGVGIRSSVPGGYEVWDGTSMAIPHVAGTVALMWSSAPVLVGDAVATSRILDRSAIDTSDLSCGGTPANNNVWGQGRLDAFAAVEASPQGP